MAGGILSDTIYEIIERINFQPDRYPNPTEINDDVLAKLKDVVETADPTDKALDDVLWLRKFKDLVNDLSESVDDLAGKNTRIIDKKMTRIIDQKMRQKSQSSLPWILFNPFPAAGGSSQKEPGTAQIKEYLEKLRRFAKEYEDKKIFAEFVGDALFEAYKKLSLFQKRCFAYCSLFPPDYPFDVPRLIKFWVAEGFLELERPKPADQVQDNGRTPDDGSPDIGPELEDQGGDKRGKPEDQGQEKIQEPEDLGKEFVGEFLNGSIFEEADDSGGTRRCIMNQKMHDLATLLSQDESNVIYPDGSNVCEGLRRVSFGYSFDQKCEIPSSLFSQAKKLRTILIPGASRSRLPNEVKISSSTLRAIISKFERLRVLDLHNLGITVLPDSISDLKDLKYLDLSQNSMEKLPDSITKLTNLLTLKLSRCHKLRKLPNNLGRLQKLRHLEIEGCLDLTQMPPGIKGLTSLQTLSHFVVSNSPTGGLEKLASLNSLRGDLEILHLQRLKLKADGNNINSFLEKNRRLEGLTLRWNRYSDEKGEENSIQLISCRPGEELKVLSIVGYQGGLSQVCFSSLKNLVKFSLYDCPRCECIPGLPKLKILELQRLDSLKYIHAQGSSASQELLESLEELALLDCPILTSWWQADNQEGEFQKIAKLEVRYCPSLTHLPTFPHLSKKLVLVSSNKEPLAKTMRSYAKEEEITEERTTKDENEAAKAPLFQLKSVLLANVKEEDLKVWIGKFTSLTDLHLQECLDLKYLPKGLNTLHSVTIENCTELFVPNDAFHGLERLRCLTLRGIPKLKSFPRELEGLTRLEDLEIHSCEELTSLPDTVDKLTSLRKLVLSKCHKLASLPKRISELKSLQTLIIRDCPLLLPRIQRETGDDWVLIEKIKEVTLSQTTEDI